MRKQKMKMFADRWWVLSGRDLFDFEASSKAKKEQKRGKATKIIPNKGTGLFSLWSYADTRPLRKKKK